MLVFRHITSVVIVGCIRLAVAEVVATLSVCLLLLLIGTREHCVVAGAHLPYRLLLLLTMDVVRCICTAQIGSLLFLEEAALLLLGRVSFLQSLCISQGVERVVGRAASRANTG